MKKASVIFSIIGFLLLGCTYYYMQESSRLITQSEQAAANVVGIMNSGKIEKLTKFISPDYGGEYYYEDIELNQTDYIAINNCMLHYIDNKSFDNANKCEEIIVDAIIENMGETSFIKAIIGSMINYKKKVSIKADFPKSLFDTGIEEAPLKSKLMLTFINRYRDSAKLKNTFNNYKKYFYNAISKKLYTQLFKSVVDIFIQNYKEINEKDDKEAFYKQIYNEAETRSKHGEFWNFTFWKRRELEKNDQTIFIILNEIKSHYER